MNLRFQAFTLVLLLPATLAFADEPAPAVRLDVCGKWHGCWVSHKNGHHGKMVATVCRVDDCQYRITFRGIFWKVFPFRYAETFRVTGFSADGIHMEASKFLGPVFGTFDCRVAINAGQLVAQFRSRNDWGEFRLERGR
jgi:hypothetical protein